VTGSELVELGVVWELGLAWVVWASGWALAVWAEVWVVGLGVVWAQGCHNLHCSGTQSPHHFHRLGHCHLRDNSHMTTHHPIYSSSTDQQMQWWPNQQSMTCAS